MNKIAIALCLLATQVLANVIRAGEGPSLRYDASRTAVYLRQTLEGSSRGTAEGLRRELSATTDEILDGPWLPLYCDYSAAQAGGVEPAEWCFSRPGLYMRVLAQAAPYMTETQKRNARTFLRGLVTNCAPTRQVHLSTNQGKPRSIRKTPQPQIGWLSEPDKQQLLFAEGYAVWAYAAAFDAWDEVKPLFADLEKLRGQLVKRGDFAPAYKDNSAGPLTAADTKSPEYRFCVYQALLAGYQDNYWYHGARQARERMQKDKPMFFYARTLSALLGYYRLARHFGHPDEARWAQQTFDQVAAMTVQQKSAPYLWSDPDMTPEIGRLVRDAAGPWLDELAKTPSVGNLPATDWDNKPAPGMRDYYVMNPYTWYHAWGGQGEGIRPHSVMGAFLANAYLLDAPAEKVAATVDIPWCKADLYYALKLIVAIQAAERTEWGEVK